MSPRLVIVRPHYLLFISTNQILMQVFFWFHSSVVFGSFFGRKDGSSHLMQSTRKCSLRRWLCSSSPLWMSPSVCDTTSSPLSISRVMQSKSLTEPLTGSTSWKWSAMLCKHLWEIAFWYSVLTVGSLLWSNLKFSPWYQLYRCWIVYGRNWLVVCVPMVLWLGTTGNFLHLS